MSQDSPRSTPRQALTIFGPGKVGEAVGRLAVQAGWTVYFVASPRHSDIQPMLDVTVPGATVRDPQYATTHSDIIVLTIPFAKAADLPWHLFDDHLVIDAMNPWPPPDRSRMDWPQLSTSQVHATWNPRMRLAKALNHLGFIDLEDDATEYGDPLRRALAFATDHDEDRPTLARLLNDLGFDAYDLGDLSQGRWVEPGFPAFGKDLNVDQFQAAIARSIDLYGNR